jgi:hypothetical protein
MWKFMVRVKGKILFLLFDIYVVSEHVAFSVRGRRFRARESFFGLPEIFVESRIYA